MSCTNCGSTIFGVCKVCELVDKDTSTKDVTYCDMCGVHICRQCNFDLKKRWASFLKLRLGIAV